MKDYFEEFKPIRNKLRDLNVFDTLKFVRENIQSSSIEKLISPSEVDFLIVNSIIYSSELPCSNKIDDVKHRKLLELIRSLNEKVSQSNIYIDPWLWLNSEYHNQTKQNNSSFYAKVYRYYRIFNNDIISNHIESKIGISYHEFMVSSLWLYSVFMKSNWFCVKKAYFNNLQSKYVNTPFAKVNKVLNILSKPLAELKEELKKTTSYKNETMFNFSYSPHIQFPIIEYLDYLYCTIPNYLITQFTSGMYYIADIPNANIANDFGKGFENYVGEILSINNKNMNLIILPEIIYFNGQKRTSDWIIIDDSNLILLECKTNRLRYQSKYQLSLNELEYTNKSNLGEDLKKLVSAVVQLYKVYFDYKSGIITGLQFDANKNFTPIVITLEEWFADNPVIDERICNLVKRELYNLKIDPNIVDFNRYKIISIETFEKEIQIMSKEGLSEYFSLLSTGKLDSEYRKNFTYFDYFSDEFKTDFIKPYLYNDK